MFEDGAHSANHALVVSGSNGCKISEVLASGTVAVVLDREGPISANRWFEARRSVPERRADYTRWDFDRRVPGGGRPRIDESWRERVAEQGLT